MTDKKMYVREILHRDGGLISYRTCPHELFGVLRRMAASGELTTVLPGIFAATERAEDVLIRMRAAQVRDPDVVFTHLTAANLLWQVPLRGPVSAIGRLRSDRPGFEFSRAVVDPEWITSRRGFRCTTPELTAVDLVPSHGGEFVDRVLREAYGRGGEALRLMWRAVEAHPDRPGNVRRREILHNSRDQPWSEAERLVHQQLREAGIAGWRTNYEVRTSSGRTYCLDIAFPEHGIDLEVEGFAVHGTRAAHRNDCVRQNDLVLDGWRPLRVTWQLIQDRGWLLWLERALSAPSWPMAPADKAKRRRTAT